MNAPPHLDERTLIDYLDGALPPADLARAERHLALCGACAAEIAGFRELATALEQLPLLRPEGDLAPAVLAAIVAAPAARLPALHHLLVAQALVAALLVTALWRWLEPWRARALEVTLSAWSALQPVVARAQAAWETWTAPLESWQSLALNTVAALPGLSWTTALLLLAGAVLLWVAANGLLLTGATGEKSA